MLSKSRENAFYQRRRKIKMAHLANVDKNQSFLQKRSWKSPTRWKKNTSSTGYLLNWNKPTSQKDKQLFHFQQTKADWKKLKTEICTKYWCSKAKTEYIPSNKLNLAFRRHWSMWFGRWTKRKKKKRAKTI